MTPDKTSLLRFLPVAVFAAVAGFFAFALSSGDPSKIPSALIGKTVPQTNFPGIEGFAANDKPVPGFSTTDLATGKVSVVNFWASWCGPCVEEHPLLTDLKASADINLYGVNYKDQAQSARRFLIRYGNPFTAVGTDTSGRAAIEWGVYGMPETFVVNGMGQIVYKHVGPLSQASIEERILPAIAKARSATSQSTQ